MKEKIENWIRELDESSDVPSDIVALNFGLYETEEGYCIYLTGSEEYDASDDEWACEVDYEPEGNFIELPSGNMDWEEFLEKTKRIISDYLSINAEHLPMFEGRVVTIGFDDGDLSRIR